MSRYSLVFCVLVLSWSLAHAIDGIAFLDGIPDNTWQKVPAGDTLPPGVGHCNITVDCDKSRIYFHGSDTHGSNYNELWYFDIVNFRWVKVYAEDPISNYVAVTNDAVLGAGKFWPAADSGRHPVAAHVFDAFKYIPGRNMALLLIHDGHNGNFSAKLGGLGEPAAWVLNTETLTWKLLTGHACPDVFMYGIGVAPDGSKAVATDGGGNTYAFDFADSAWNNMNAPQFWASIGHHVSMEYDANDGRFIDIRDNLYSTFDYDTKTWTGFMSYADTGYDLDGPTGARLLNGVNAGYDTLNRVLMVQSVTNPAWGFGNPYPERDYTWIRCSAGPEGKRWRIVKRWDHPGDTLPPYNGFSFKAEYDLAHNAFFFMNGNQLWVYRYKTAATHAKEQAMTGVTLLTDKSAIELYLFAHLRYVMSGPAGASDTSTNFLFCEAVSLDTAVAKVDGYGTVTAAGIGTARIMIDKNGFKDTVTITVAASSATLDSIVISPAAISRMVSEPCTLSATGYFHKDAETFTRILDTVATWSSSDNAKLSINKGLLTLAQAGGPVTVTTSLSGKSGSAAVTVWPRPAFIRRINFQVSATPWKFGWLADNGAAYSDAQGFGWATGSGGSSRDDRMGTNFLLKSFVQPTDGSQYKIMAVDGSYIVKIAMGDNQYGASSVNATLYGTDTVGKKAAGVANGIKVDTITVSGGAGAVFSVYGPINYIVMISNEGIDVNQVADDGDTAYHGTAVDTLLQEQETAGSISATPNPFNPTVLLRLGWNAGAASSILIYDIHGQCVERLMADKNGTAEWKAAGRASGVYVVRCSVNGKMLTRRVVLAR